MTPTAAERSRALWSDQPPVDKLSLIADLASVNDRQWALPPHWYTDEGIHRVEREEIFRRTWQLVGPLGERLPEVGDFVTLEVADVPVVLVRSAEGLRGFVNVCRHRGHEVAQGCGNRSTLQCVYHGWTYDLDGELRGVPRGRRERDFDQAKFPLFPVRVGTWGPFVFVNLEPVGPSFEAEFEHLLAYAGERGVDLDATKARAEVSFDFACNWKVYVTNTQDCYHCPIVHPSFAKGFHVDPDHYVIESHDRFAYHRSPVKDHTRESGLGDWELFSVWPSWSVTCRGWRDQYLFRRIVPLDPGRIEIVTTFCAPDSVTDDEIDEAIENYRLVVREDGDVAESVQRTARSGYPPEGGPLLLDSEFAVRDFQLRLQRSLESGSYAL